MWMMKTDGEVEVFAGSEREEGSVDGKVNDCQFRQPMGICTETESVIYICDAQTNFIKICTKMVECAETPLVSLLMFFLSIAKELLCEVCR